MELCPSLKLHDCNLVGFKQALTARRKRHHKEYRRRKKNSLMGFNFFPFCPALQCACCGARHTNRANPLAACTTRGAFLPAGTHTDPCRASAAAGCSSAMKNPRRADLNHTEILT